MRAGGGCGACTVTIKGRATLCPPLPVTLALRSVSGAPGHTEKILHLLFLPSSQAAEHMRDAFCSFGQDLTSWRRATGARPAVPRAAHGPENLSDHSGKAGLTPRPGSHTPTHVRGCLSLRVLTGCRPQTVTAPCDTARRCIFHPADRWQGRRGASTPSPVWPEVAHRNPVGMMPLAR